MMATMITSKYGCDAFVGGPLREPSEDNDHDVGENDDYMKTRSLGALPAPTSSCRPFGPLDFVLRALRALRTVRRARLWSGLELENRISESLFQRWMLKAP